MLKKTMFAAASMVAAGGLLQALPGTATAASSSPRHEGQRHHVTEYYRGHVYSLTPTNWHGATNCAVVESYVAYCYDTKNELTAFTNSPLSSRQSAITGSPDSTTGTCNGWVKIWDGPNWTGRGLAFHNYDNSGNDQYLGDYAPVPFSLHSWFTDGQRSYAPMTNCYAYTGDYRNYNAEEHTNAEARSTSPLPAYSITIFSGVQ